MASDLLNSKTKNVLKKGLWTISEDVILVEYVKKHGEGNWNAVQRNSGLMRCGKSCRLRWANHLRPNLKKGAFAPEEEKLIIDLHAKFGNKWVRMATQIELMKEGDSNSTTRIFVRSSDDSDSLSTQQLNHLRQPHG